MRTVAAFALLLITTCACGDDDESAGSRKPRPLGELPADPSPYPDSKSGLTQLLDDLLAAVKSDDTARVREMVGDLVLVDADEWFATTFGAEPGAALARDYRPAATGIDQMAGLLAALVSDGQTEVNIERFDRADDPAAIGYQALALAKAERPVTLYSARLCAPGQQRGFHLWSFVYQNGKFRWVGKMTALSGEPPPTGDEVDPLELRRRDHRRHHDR